MLVEQRAEHQGQRKAAVPEGGGGQEPCPRRALVPDPEVFHGTSGFRRTQFEKHGSKYMDTP